MIPRISIHALREEGDVCRRFSSLVRSSNFYPRPPRGGRPNNGQYTKSGLSFLSTPSARRATLVRSSRTSEMHFYPRPPRGGRPAGLCGCSEPFSISIHALREEGDRTSVRRWWCPGYFYPRPPRGGRQLSIKANAKTIVFLSTPSARRATHAIVYDLPIKQISIHALREEGDPEKTQKEEANEQFLSTPSARRATHFATLSQIP